MNRILFAAARGARIQRYGFVDQWEPALWCALPNNIHQDQKSLRIHPDDAHLQYGPVSSALREAAATGSTWDLTGEAGLMALTVLRNAGWRGIYADDLNSSLFLLLMAEALADEGL